MIALSALAVGAAALTTTGSALSPEAPRAQTADELLQQMTLEQKVGQLFVTYAYGRTADTPDPVNREEFGVDTPAQVVEKYHLGGIIHFTWSNSLYDPKQIAELSNGLQTAATSSGARVPLLISTDQEQGQVTRITEPATQLPGNMALGAGRDPVAAERSAAITGRELRAMGLNMNFAPSGDVNVNPANPVIGVRSFSSDPALAAQFTAAQVRGYEDAQPAGEGVSASVKHFPGHGDTNTDSHTALPVIEHDRQQWEQLDAPPFKEAIAAGTDSVMSAHIVVPKLDDSGRPATLAPNVLTGMLRQELGYQGVVFTDSLQMEGVREQHPDAEIPVLALQAGADVMLMPQNLQVAIDGVIAAVRDGRLTEQRIDESVSRVLKLKEQRGVLADPFVDTGQVDSVVGSREHLDEAQRITDPTTTLLRNDAALPLKSPGSVFVTGASEKGTRALSDSVRARGPRSSALATDLQPTPEQIGQAVERAKASDVAVVLTNAAWNPDNASQLDLVRALQQTGKPVIAVATRDPYDAAYADVPAWIASYSDKPVAMESVAKVLFGETAPRGKLPVPVPEPGKPGTDRYPFGFGLGW
ncbi:glycoside hydrolase family 3 protein [Saccharopolyspora sp. TS4A08]|uniref:beta-N-acetylhexosaminidase n=1 Tax=Saccharopolyspora ipomoeae TaxID=3042027 RepID=A0ABT6PXS1_9PSEU|nr:glycoside hydrolase family 3 protein [Saccharopolyspora sp. TS4A08]MDI2032803.1 glycoside hydrolase family 3 protein [Saccharopolyspora sp. TS4A08]